MAMHGQSDVVDAGYVRLQVTEQFVELGRNRITDRIRNVDGRGTRFDRRRDDLGEIPELGP